MKTSFSFWKIIPSSEYEIISWIISTSIFTFDALISGRLTFSKVLKQSIVNILWTIQINILFVVLIIILNDMWTC